MKGTDLVALTERDDAELSKFHGPGAEPHGQRRRRRDQGFKRELDIVGVGYRAELKGKQVVFALGYSHPIVFDIPAGSTSPWTSRRTSP
jgi:large subunit ribosomal protein L6